MNIKQNFYFLSTFLSLLVLLQACSRSSDDFWDDTKSAGRHVQRGILSIAGQDKCSRQIRSSDEFECTRESAFDPNLRFQDYDYVDSFRGSHIEEFVPLEDENNEIAMNYDLRDRPSRESPGEVGSSLPGLQAFIDPSTSPHLCGIFRPIYFNYDCNLIKGNDNLQSLHTIAEYMNQHPNVYVFVEGHTDLRGAHAYNQSLGSRRCNEVRSFLIRNGVNPDNLFTISYGKERPAVLEDHEEAHARNRRAEFKVYER